MNAQPTPGLGLDQLASSLKRMAEDRNLVVVPAMPINTYEQGWVVVLGRGDMVADDFIALASAVDAKLLYISAEPFSADKDLSLSVLGEDSFMAISEQAEAELARIRADVTSFDGHIGIIRLGFAERGVLHCWAAKEAWYDQAMTRLAQMADTDDDGVSAPRFGWTPEEMASADRVAIELFDMPSFRSAQTYTHRRSVAREEHAQIAAWEEDLRLRPLAQIAIGKAEQRVREDAERVLLALEPRLRELAAEFADTPTWRDASSARARREHARDFLKRQANGYLPTTRLLELFLDTPPLQRKRTL